MKNIILVIGPDSEGRSTLTQTMAHLGYEVRGARIEGHALGFLGENLDRVLGVIVDHRFVITVKILEALAGKVPSVVLSEGSRATTFEPIRLPDLDEDTRNVVVSLLEQSYRY